MTTPCAHGFAICGECAAYWQKRISDLEQVHEAALRAQALLARDVEALRARLGLREAHLKHCRECESYKASAAATPRGICRKRNVSFGPDDVACVLFAEVAP